MQALKTIVITLGVVLTIAFGLLIYGLSQNWHRAAEAPVATRPAAPAGSWGSVTLGTPGERITGVTAAGDLAVVQLTNEHGGSRLHVVDPRSGRVVGGFVTGNPP